MKEKLWEEFKGKGNSDDVLFDKAKAISSVVIALAKIDTESIFKNFEWARDVEKDKGKEVNREKFGQVFFEIVLFYLHFIDTKAFQYLNAEQRHFFIFALLVDVRELIPSIHEANIDGAQFHSIFESTFNERTMEYGKYKNFLPEKGETMTDTLYWKLGEKITEILGWEINLQVHILITASIIPELTLQLSELFEE